MLRPFHGWLSDSSRPSPRPALSQGLNVESLESRDLFAGEPVGTEVRVNTSTTGPQQLSPESPGAVAMDADGNYVVVWSGNVLDGSDFNIYGQRFNAAGVALGGEFLVNTFTPGVQKFATVAMDADGDFVVTWTSYDQQPGSLGEILAQRYDENGARVGGEIQVNGLPQFNQRWSTVAMDDAGNFVVTWTSSGQDGSGEGIYAAVFNANGTTRAGGEFRVNINYTAGNQLRSAVAMDADGDFVVTWQSYGAYPAGDGSSNGIFAQRFNSNALAQGEMLRVNAFTANTQLSPAVAMDDSGDFVIVWAGYGPDAVGYDIYAQRFNSSGTFQGQQIHVNTFVTAGQTTPRVAMDADGDFVVAWTSYGQDTFGGGIFAQRFNAAGVPQGIEFLVNTFTSFNQNFPSVAMDADGDFVVVWNSVGQPGEDNYGVYAQRFLGAGTGGGGGQIGNAVVAVDPLDNTKTALFVTGTTGNDSIKVVMKSTGYVVDINGFRFTTTFAFTGRIYIDAGDGNDKVSYDAKGLAQAVIDGGNGNDKLYGGKANDIIRGGAGNDYINGQGGKDLLLGGTGKDKLYGGGTGSVKANEGNIIIGDTTDFDANLAALASILSAWEVNDQATVAGFFNSATVHGDGQSDYIRSTPKGIDWAFSFELKSNGKRLDQIVFGSTDLIN